MEMGRREGSQIRPRAQVGVMEKHDLVTLVLRLKFCCEIDGL